MASQSGAGANNATDVPPHLACYVLPEGGIPSFTTSNYNRVPLPPVDARSPHCSTLWLADPVQFRHIHEDSFMFGVVAEALRDHLASNPTDHFALARCLNVAQGMFGLPPSFASIQQVADGCRIVRDKAHIRDIFDPRLSRIIEAYHWGKEASADARNERIAVYKEIRYACIQWLQEQKFDLDVFDHQGGMHNRRKLNGILNAVKTDTLMSDVEKKKALENLEQWSRLYCHHGRPWPRAISVVEDPSERNRAWLGFVLWMISLTGRSIQSESAAKPVTVRPEARGGYADRRLLPILTTLSGRVKTSQVEAETVALRTAELCQLSSCATAMNAGLASHFARKTSHDILLALARTPAYREAASLQISQRRLNGLTVHCVVYQLYIEGHPIVVWPGFRAEAMRFLRMMASIAANLDTITYAYYNDPAMPPYVLARKAFPRLLYAGLIHARAKGEFLSYVLPRIDEGDARDLENTYRVLAEGDMVKESKIADDMLIRSLGMSQSFAMDIAEKYRKMKKEAVIVNTSADNDTRMVQEVINQEKENRMAGDGFTGEGLFQDQKAVPEENLSESESEESSSEVSSSSGAGVTAGP